ncbi:hypothetical protein HY768_05600 [candidate division TA06 bacterium]|uniref:Uncharacterized protein n=1 Tax=candidate division TA06 bacterium TaxID=2250710 RepID=A0A933IC84_UNCT6|nr:hypothetical protein [candidate division TA06 bacterium]
MKNPIKDFQTHEKRYLSSDYSEAQARHAHQKYMAPAQQGGQKLFNHRLLAHDDF